MARSIAYPRSRSNDMYRTAITTILLLSACSVSSDEKQNNNETTTTPDRITHLSTHETTGTENNNIVLQNENSQWTHENVDFTQHSVIGIRAPRSTDPSTLIPEWDDAGNLILKAYQQFPEEHEIIFFQIPEPLNKINNITVNYID
jgi:hypothetical protein